MTALERPDAASPEEALARACHAGALAAADPRGWPSIEAAARG